MVNGPTLAELAQRLACGATTSRALVEDCLARIADPAGEGGRAFLHVAADEARAAADGIDALRRAGAAPSCYAGIPVSIKDLFDIAGQVTTAGSRVLADAAPAAETATAVARLQRAGFIVIGRTNMTEFAFSGVGLNPHYGTPKSPWRREAGHIPGGSSSGAAVSVADQMAHAGLGTDTGGSCRIPAAFCGLVGFKPTATRVPRDGAVPLSTTLDSVGPLARTVACCATVDRVLAGEEERPLVPSRLKQLRLAVPRTFVMGDVDNTVGRAFERALSRLAAAGALIEEIDVAPFARLPAINAKGGFSAPEALAWHRELIAAKGAGYDPRVLVRIKRGLESSAVDHVELIAARARFIAEVAALVRDYDALAMPTTPIAPPPIAALDKDDDYSRINMLVLRNPSVINVLDGCAISVPMHEAGEPPVGLMLAGLGGSDHALLRHAAAVEAALQAKK